MRMPFGKYKGLYLEEIPLNYIKWLLTETQLREPLKQEVEKIWIRFNGELPQTMIDEMDKDEMPF